MNDIHAGKPIRCPYCGGREAEVSAHVTGVRVVREAGTVSIPAISVAYVSEQEDARCVICAEIASFGAWLGMAAHMPADVA